MLVDRESSRVAIVASTEGGMDIEKVAHDTPDKIVTITVDPVANICPHHVRRLSKALGLTGDLQKQMSPLITNLYKAFVESDMSLLEVNPLIITKDGKLLCLDAKIGFDDNALFRHPDLAALRDETEEDEKEIEASKYDLNYIALDGEIGCMVNGAGLAMATMDIIKLYGLAPANFLDVGGSATTEKVTAAFKIITSDPNVKGILVNIFGGIMKCDVIAEGVVTAVKEVGLQRAAGGAPRRHQCREGQGDHREVEPQCDFGRRPRRCRAEDREGGEGQVMLKVAPTEPQAPPPPERGRSVREANRVGVARGSIARRSRWPRTTPDVIHERRNAALAEVAQSAARASISTSSILPVSHARFLLPDPTSRHRTGRRPACGSGAEPRLKSRPLARRTRSALCMRFWNSDITQNLKGVLEVIATKIGEFQPIKSDPHPALARRPPPSGGGVPSSRQR